MSFNIQLMNGAVIEVEEQTAIIGRDAGCRIALPYEEALQPFHARIRQVAGRWMIESLGEWLVQVERAVPSRVNWLQSGEEIRLTEAGPTIRFRLGKFVATFKEPSLPKPERVRPSSLQAASPSLGQTRTVLPGTPGDVGSDKPIWYYSIEGTSLGPCTWKQLKEMAATGLIAGSDPVWQAGSSHRCPAASLPGLIEVPTAGISPAAKAVANPSSAPRPKPSSANATPTPSGHVSTNRDSALPPKLPVSSPMFEEEDSVLPTVPPQNPLLMAVLSGCVFGLGHLFLGQTAKSLTLFVIGLAVTILTLGIAAPIVIGFLAYDAFLIASKLQQETPVKKWDFFWSIVKKN